MPPLPDALRDLDRERKVILGLLLGGVPLVALGVFGLLVANNQALQATFPGRGETGPIAVAVLMLAGPLGAGLLGGFSLIQVYDRRARQLVGKATLNRPSCVYTPAGSLPRQAVGASGFWQGRVMTVGAHDLISGTVDGHPLTLASFESGSSKLSDPTTLVTTASDSSLEGRVVLIPTRKLNALTEGLTFAPHLKKHYKPIPFPEAPEFEAVWNVFADSEAEARAWLTPAYRELLLANCDPSAPFRVSRNGAQLFLALTGELPTLHMNVFSKPEAMQAEAFARRVEDAIALASRLR